MKPNTTRTLLSARLSKESRRICVGKGNNFSQSLLGCFSLFIYEKNNLTDQVMSELIRTLMKLSNDDNYKSFWPKNAEVSESKSLISNIILKLKYLSDRDISETDIRNQYINELTLDYFKDDYDLLILLFAFWQKHDVFILNETSAKIFEWATFCTVGENFSDNYLTLLKNDKKFNLIIPTKITYIYKTKLKHPSKCKYIL